MPRVVALSLLLASCLCQPSLAQGQEGGPAASPEAGSPIGLRDLFFEHLMLEEGLALLVVDRDGVLGGAPPRLQITGEQESWEIELLDDGAEPDWMAGDACYVGVAFVPTQQSVQFSLQSATGESLWTEMTPLSGPGTTPRVGVLFEGGAVSALLHTWHDENGQPLDTSPSDPGGPSGEAVSQEQTSRAQAPQLVLPGWFWPALAGCAVLGLVLGGLLALLTRRRRALGPATRPVGRSAGPWLPEALPRLPSGASYWLVPDADLRRQLVVSLAREGAAHGPVLLVSTEGSRPWFVRALVGQPDVVWLDGLRPTHAQLARALRGLGAQGPVTVLVEGSEALEPPNEREEPEAVLDEFLYLSLEAENLVVLACRGEPEPEYAPLELRVEGERWVCDQGVVVGSGGP